MAPAITATLNPLMEDYHSPACRRVRGSPLCEGKPQLMVRDAKEQQRSNRRSPTQRSTRHQERQNSYQPPKREGRDRDYEVCSCGRVKERRNRPETRPSGRHPRDPHTHERHTQDARDHFERRPRRLASSALDDRSSTRKMEPRRRDYKRDFSGASYNSRKTFSASTLTGPSPVDAVAAIRAMRAGLTPPHAEKGSEFEESRSAQPSIQATDLEQTWDKHPKLMRAVRTEAPNYPDHIQAQVATYRKSPVSPFALYYHDETAPNPVMLAGDLRSSHASKHESVVKGNEYGGDNAVVSARSVQSTGRSPKDLRSYYTESAFTTISANAMSRPLLNGQQLEEQLQAAASKIARQKRGCCGLRRGISASTLPVVPSNYAAIDYKDMTQVVPRQDEQPVSASQLPPATADSAAMLFEERRPQTTSITPEFLQQAYTHVGKEGTRYSRVRRTNYVSYTPPTQLAEKYGHPAYVEAVAVERQRQAEHLSGVGAAYPLVSHQSPCKDDDDDDDEPQVRHREILSGDRNEPTKKKLGREKLGTEKLGREKLGKSKVKRTRSTSSDYHRSRMCPTCRRAFDSDRSWCQISSEGEITKREVQTEITKRGTQTEAAPYRRRFSPAKIPEKERETGYHVRKHFFNAKTAEVPPNGTAMKPLPQYTVSYKNYPEVAFDVIVPENNKQFYVERSAPNFFLP